MSNLEDWFVYLGEFANENGKKTILKKIKSSLKLVLPSTEKEEDVPIDLVAKVYDLETEVAVLFSLKPIKIPCVCVRCLKEIEQKLIIKDFERHYFYKKPADVTDFEEYELIDSRKMRISIKRPVEEEIILHFSENPVCLQSCKGICPKCGKNLNEFSCKCGQKKVNLNENPFAILKKSLKK